MSRCEIIGGDCLDMLPTLSAESVHCVVTSPPYWGLRDYGTAEWEGGDPACDHSPKRRGSRFATPVSTKQASNTGSGTASRRDCACGAVRIDRQLGLESSPEEYVEKLVAVFREVRRVLRGDGTVWLNLGDSYNSIGHKKSHSGFGTTGLAGGRPQDNFPAKRENTAPGLKHKDLVGIPWRVAFALQADGWWLRSAIVWHKPNPMPESVRDRPTSSYELVFLLAKSERYYFDAEAVRERHGWPDSRPRMSYNGKGNPAGRLLSGDAARLGNNPAGRNIRNVWTIATKPFPEAHFATFPEDLVVPCVLAGSPIGGTVLDPFAGAGTVGVVCSKHGRDFIGIELNPEYAEMARRRIGNAPLSLFAAHPKDAAR